MNCDFCERPIPDGMAVCPHCGRLQKTASQWGSYYRSILLFVILALLIFFGWGYFIGFH